MEPILEDEIVSSEWTDKDDEIVVQAEIDKMLGLDDVTSLG